MSTDKPELNSDADADADADAESDTDTDTIVDDVELRDPDELIPYHNNPKDHPEWQIDKIASSIKNYGMDQPIVVDGDNEIIKGHGRLKAAKKIGLEEVPVIRREDLSEAKAKGSRIADNKTHMDTGWDIESLALEFEELEGEGFDPELAGFDEDEVDAILDQQEFDIDEFFEESDGSEDSDGSDSSDDSDEFDFEGEVECPECGHAFHPSEDEPMDSAAEPIDGDDR